MYSILNFSQNLLLQTSPRFFARFCPIGTKAGLKDSLEFEYEKLLKKDFSPRGAKTYKVGEATSNRMSYLPNWILICIGSWRLATWCCYKIEKHKNGYNYIILCPINLKTVMQCLSPKCHYCMAGHLCILSLLL